MAICTIQTGAIMQHQHCGLLFWGVWIADLRGTNWGRISEWTQLAH